MKKVLNENMKILVIMILVLSHFSCVEREKNINEKKITKFISKFIIKNEVEMNREINKIILNRIKNKGFSYNWNKETVVIYDTDKSILGKLANLLATKNECLAISYTYSKDTLEKKIIEVFQDTTRIKFCEKLPSISLEINSSKFFIPQTEIWLH